MFSEFVSGHLDNEKSDWDNLSDEELITNKKSVASTSFENCQMHCSKNRKCVQYNYRPGECRIGSSIRYGRRDSGVKSGWNLKKIEAFLNQSKKCRPTWNLR